MLLLKVKCIWLCWLEYFLTLVAKALSLCQEDRQACAQILILQSGTLDDAVETYLQQQFEQDISPWPRVKTP